MKYLSAKLFLLAISFLLTASLSAQDASGEQGTLSVTSAPSGSWVKVDSVLVGKTPLELLPLSAGLHQIQVYPPNNGIWNLEEKRYEVIIHPNQDSKIHTKFSSPIYVNSTPFGAELYADTTRLGMTPLYIPFEPNRGKFFRLSKHGFKDYEFQLNENKSILAHLEKDESFIEDREKPQLLGVIPKRHIKSKFSLLALTVASHWASFYFKNQADSNFDKYSQTGDAGLRDQYWDSTQKYDRLSEITLGVSYASLAGLIYMVIWK